MSRSPDPSRHRPGRRPQPPPRGPRAVRALAAAALLGLAAPLACSPDEPAEGAAAELAAGTATDDYVTAGETARAIAEHRLTEERVERWFDAQERLDALVAEDPTLDGRLRGSGGWLRGEGAAIDQAVRRLEDDPRTREAIAEAGLSPRDFVMTGLALHQALLAAGPGAPADLRRVAARNVRFVSANADLLRRYADGRRSSLAAGEDSLGDPYDPFADPAADSVDYGGDVDPDADVPPDTVAPPDTTIPPPGSPLPTDTTLRPPPASDTLRPRLPTPAAPPVLPPLPPPAPPPAR